MKKMYFVFLSVIMVSLAMSCTRIDAGYVGIKVDMLGQGKGAVTEVPPGWQFHLFSPNISYFRFPQFLQTYKWTEGKDEGSPNDEAIRFQTKEGLQITSDIGISFNVNKEPGTGARLYTTYRNGIDEIIDGVLRNYVRDTFMRIGSQYTADEIIGNKKAELLTSVEEDVRKRFAPDIEVVSLSWLSSPRPPQSVIDALNAKVQATQIAMQRENEVRTAMAEAEKIKAQAEGKAASILIEAQAQAKANELLSKSITPNLIEIKRIEKWNGAYPTVTGSGGTIMDMRVK